MSTNDNIPGYDTVAVQAWIKAHVTGLEPPFTLSLIHISEPTRPY